MSKQVEIVIKPTKRTTKKEQQQAKEVINEEQIAQEIVNEEAVKNPEIPKNVFDKNSVEDMKRLKSLKDKIRRCELAIKKYNDKLVKLNLELNQ